MLLLFDLDGTLTDPFDGITAAAAHALAAVGAPPLSVAQQRAFIGPPLQDSFAALGLDAEQVAAAVTAYRDYFGDRGLLENRVYDGIPGALDALAGAGHRLAIATSKPRPFAVRILAHVELAAYFETVSAATLDGSVRHKTDIIDAALAALDVCPAEALMVGDRSHDVLGARSSGLAAIGAGWGYAEPGELAAAGAAVVVHDPAALPAAVAVVASQG